MKKVRDSMDRTLKGIIAGTTGAVVMNIWDFISFYILNFHDHLLLDWASILIYGHKPDNSIEYIYSLIYQISWSGLLGVLFVLIIPLVTSNYLLLKGASYGFIIVFFLLFVGQAFKIPGLTDFTTTVPISHSIGATVFGLVLAQTILWLDKIQK